MPRGVRKTPRSEPGQTRLYVPRLSSAKVGDMIQNFGGRDYTAKALRVAPELIDRWISEELETPQSVLLCLFWLSPQGFKEAFNQSHWTHQYNSFLKNEARARVELLENFIVAHGLGVPAGALTTPGQMLLAGPEAGHWLSTGEAGKKQLRARLSASGPVGHAAAGSALGHPAPANAEPTGQEQRPSAAALSRRNSCREATTDPAEPPPIRAAARRVRLVSEPMPVQMMAQA